MDGLKEEIAAQCKAAGFDIFRVTTPDAAPHAGAKLQDFLAAGRHGDMDWLARNADRRADPQVLWPEARSVLLLGLNYGPAQDPLVPLGQREKGVISVYAQGKDYHGIVKTKLKRIAGWLHRETGAEVKVFVDTAPVLEKPLAAAAGLGWQGKHTNLVSREFGSWLFLGSIFTTLEIPIDSVGKDHCGTCRQCLDICPTDAFPAPYQLDARRCISYLTIEHRGHIARRYRKAMGNRIFGCDDCLAVCPWNRFAKVAAETRLHARAAADSPPLADLLPLDDQAFRDRFAGTPIKRTGRDRFIRNALIAAGNSETPEILNLVEPLLRDASPLVRAMAVWAAARLSVREKFQALGQRLLPEERDPQVREEWSMEGIQ